MAKDLIVRSSAEEFIIFKIQEKDKVWYKKASITGHKRFMHFTIECHV